MWHFKGTFGTSSFFSGPLLALLKTGRPSFPPETKRIKWKNEVVETWIKPCSHINRRNKTKTYIFQKVPHWNEEESKSAQIPQKILRVCLFLGGGGFYICCTCCTSHDPDSLQPTEHNGDIYPGGWTGGGGAKTRQFCSSLNSVMTTTTCVKLPPETRITATFQNKSETPAGVPAGAPAGGLVRAKRCCR